MSISSPKHRPEHDPSYQKHFDPLESSPEVLDKLIQLLGVPDEIAFEDVFALDEPEFLPRPALAMILVFPTTEAYESRKAAFEAGRPLYCGSGDEDPVIWFKQSINNACGLYAVLHALCNSEAPAAYRCESNPASLLGGHYLVAQVLEDSAELEQAYAKVAVKGCSAVPEHAEDEVDFHYIFFARSNKDAHLYELDGDCKGPIDTGVDVGPEHDILAPDSLTMIKRYIDLERGNPNFNLMALVRRKA
ncbi:ubiquitin carboxyl-terminal hydrolase, family 1 [Apodospora peruviana]|uniref:Ubiquitin carboxyl-terminal hydrolase n=1 Tax=Apodospora peruviana TaxID=516989 RepID=A0AAE0ICT2_9PEZI|nr:ubiquitin carboxyl-terminal hydrolase, family 1 [Apodospora peruviana]